MESVPNGDQDHSGMVKTCRDSRTLISEDWRSEKKSSKKDSLDSGIANVRDQHASSSKSFGACTDSESAELEVNAGMTTYLKGKFIGKGGFAHVHELLDLSTRVVYACKIIPKTRIAKPHQAQKIAREISIHRNLIHKHVVRLHHFFEDKSNAYIVLEYCSRRSLLHVLKHRYTVTEPEARYYLRQLVEGVQYIHSQKVIHRDLKPGNMFLSEDMTVKLGDFGLATLVDGNGKVSICGTPNYIAPEVLNKLSYSFEADVWAIGCILFALLVGQPPFETASLKETYRRIVNNKYDVPKEISENARKLIRQLLQPQPESRLELEQIKSHEFFEDGYTPETLSPKCCYFAPLFTANCTTSHLSPPKTQASTKSIPSSKIVSSPRVASLKQKISNVLCPDKIGKKKNYAANLHYILMQCLRLMSTGQTTKNPTPVVCYPLFITKWIDYSNKYGFGFQLSDKSVGVLFNDNTRMGYNPDKSLVEFHDMHGCITTHSHDSVPEALQSRLVLMKHFMGYMQENLTDGGDVPVPSFGSKSIPHMKRWVRTNTTIIMELSNGTLQINFFKDHTKVIISPGKNGYLITYINGERQSNSYWLHQLAVSGCEKSISNRLKFAAAVLQEFANLDERAGEK